MEMAHSLMTGLPAWIPDRPIDWVLLVLALIPILYAIKQKRDQERDLEQQREIALQNERGAEEAKSKLNQANEMLQAAQAQIKDLARQIPTKAISQFPNNVADLQEFMDVAKSELLIMKDFLGYAAYSNHKDFQVYMKTLGEKSYGMSVKLLLYSLRRWLERRSPSSFPRASPMKTSDQGRNVSTSFADAPKVHRQKIMTHFATSCLKKNRNLSKQLKLRSR